MPINYVRDGPPRRPAQPGVPAPTADRIVYRRDDRHVGPSASNLAAALAAAPTPDFDWTRDWCRACGQGASSGASCSACGAELERSSQPVTRVGLIFEQRRKLRPARRGLCIKDAGALLTLHFPGKETQELPADGVRLTDLVPQQLSLAGRLMFATREVPDHDWDEAAVAALVAELTCSSLGQRRALASEALAHGWRDTFNEVELTPSEKAWLSAHEAAAYGDVQELARQLDLLPAAGYQARVGLLIPYLDVVLAQPPAWLPLLESWTEAGLPGARELVGLVAGGWVEAVPAGIVLLRATGRADAAALWQAALEVVVGDQPKPPPPGATSVAWSAAARAVQGRSGMRLDNDLSDLSALALPVLDDLVDAGALVATSQLDTLPLEPRRHLLARLAPERLDESALVALEHHAELARRAFLGRDRAALSRLPDTADVVHYRALLEVVAGGMPNEQQLRPGVVALLSEARQAQAALREGLVQVPPPAVLQDPSVWVLLEQDARDGRVALGHVDRAQFPDFAVWSDVQHLLGLAWQARWPEVERLGRAVAAAATEVRHRQEALNLMAFALYQQGRNHEALTLLDRALAERPTEALLVNSTLVAVEGDPAGSLAYFARLLQELTTIDLKRSALSRAIEIWDGLPDPDLPPQLLPALREVLTAPCPVADYYRLLRVARYAAPATVRALASPSDERRGVHDLMLARIRLSEDASFTLGDLAHVFITVYRQWGRADWFDREWAFLVESNREAMFVDFGTAIGSAVFWDTVYLEAPELLTTFERLSMLPQAGAHMAASFRDNERSWLSDAALGKFFHEPAETVIAGPPDLAGPAVEYLAENLAKCIGVAAINYCEACRGSLAESYNELVGRLRWDQANGYAILQEMRRNLDQSQQAINQLDRLVDRLRRLPVSAEERERALNAIWPMIDDWRRETVRLRADL